MNPTWLTLLIGIAGSLIGAAFTGAIWYGALRYWMGKRESFEANTTKTIDDHEDRLRVLERGPLDYVR